MKPFSRMLELALVGGLLLTTCSVTTNADQSINLFKAQTTNDATVATTQKIQKLTQADLNHFIPTQAQKVIGNQVTDPGSDAIFIPKVNYQASQNPQNQLKVPNGYTLKKLKYAASNKAIGNYRIQIQMGKIGLRGLAINSFTPAKRDLKRPVNLNRITFAQSKELTRFALLILNPAIQKLGGIPYRATTNSIQFAQASADVYSKDNWNNTGDKTGHDPKVKPVVSKAFNVKDVAEENYSDNPSFNLTSPKLKQRTVSMATLKATIYSSMAIQMYEDGPSYWGHATALMNLDIHPKYQPNYFGVGFDKFGGIHFMMVPHNHLVNRAFVLGQVVVE
ncbi:SEC10/PgrA surface exclusion domain-containing protein [Nicoliella spurrieriana]|uniref:SEC10/PgrA surface exclusion domain-containing protein n=1 Tax=Nicoliella spurrieriana TaxID=2925830 RepID=A0A976RT26_9LACO|nr:SEC10/PgrA surface exclusion domain-containing protein [Nicoliella spurrieriana]UQS87312.1 SEC10/PgrA surface exclusion domain-containing protein [Nicoliella spurrieriana]